MNQRLKIKNLIGPIEETMPNWLLKIFKSLLRSTPAIDVIKEYRKANLRKR